MTHLEAAIILISLAMEKVEDEIGDLSKNLSYVAKVYDLEFDELRPSYCLLNRLNDERRILISDLNSKIDYWRDIKSPEDIPGYSNLCAIVKSFISEAEEDNDPDWRIHLDIVKSFISEAPESTLADFKAFHKAYPARKRGCDTEFNNFKKRYSNYKALLLLLLPAIEAQKAHHIQLKAATGFAPNFPNMSTWINQRRWEDELEPINTQENETRIRTAKEGRPEKRYSSGNLNSEERKGGVTDLKDLANAILQDAASQGGE